jgi:glutamine amidotransferase
MTVAIIDYGSSNLRSAVKAFELAAENVGLKTRVLVTSNPSDLKLAKQIVLPGVGAFADCRRGLAKLDGMEKALEEHVRGEKKPFLGICVGMQLMATIGREHENTKGLDWLPGEVVALSPSEPELKIPHMGWNNINLNTSTHPLLKGIEKDKHFYFVHSYVFKPDENSDVIATFDYGGPFVAIVGRENIFGTQFHPEKSDKIGLQIINNFMNL